jgi:hypothetical protein
MECGVKPAQTGATPLCDIRKPLTFTKTHSRWIKSFLILFLFKHFRVGHLFLWLFDFYLEKKYKNQKLDYFIRFGIYSFDYLTSDITKRRHCRRTPKWCGYFVALPQHPKKLFSFLSQQFSFSDQSSANIVVLLRHNFFKYRKLLEWINKPFETLPVVPEV